MTQFTHRLTELLSRPWARLQRRFQTARPGSVLIMVVALIVLLALMGTAYVGSARNDRFGAMATINQRALRETADSYAKQLMDQVKSLVMIDANSGNLHTAPSDGQTTTQFIAARPPTLLPDMLVAGPSTQFPATPVWPVISRFAGQKFESPWKATAVASLASTQFQAGSGSYFAPSNIVVNYPNSGSSQTDPSLYGQTRTFPAFMQYVPDPNNPNQYFPVPAGPFLVGDAMGTGIADAAMIRLTTSSIQGVDFYGGMRVIDGNSGFNATTAWGRGIDQVGGTPNSFNFRPTDLDFHGAMNATLAASVDEMAVINTKRFKNAVMSNGKFDDANGNHTDIDYLNYADQFWQGLGRRPDYPNFRNLLGDPASNLYLRPFGDSDTAALAYHGGLLNLENPLSKLDLLLSTDAMTAGRDSIYASAANAVTNPQNRFRYFAANNVGYWYDWYWNFDGVASPAGAKVKFPLTTAGNPNPFGKSVSGLPFHSLRGLTVGRNPVANVCRMVDYATLPAAARTAFITPAEIVPVPDPVHPTKTSLNTDEFPELWRAFINVLGGAGNNDPITGRIPFSVPGDNPLTPNVNGGIFRNVLRGPASLSSQSRNFISPIDTASKRFDSHNVLLLRAALAAVNVETLRNGHGYNPAPNFFIPDPVRRTISLQTNTGAVQVSVYGVTANPYIGEVYANTDQTDQGSGSGIKNEKGIVAVKLYNPYPYPIDLSDYSLSVVDRKTGGTYPNMKVTALDKTDFKGKQIAPNGTVLITNYNPGGPKAPDTIKSLFFPRGAGILPAQTIHVSDLYKALEDPLTPAHGGELVLLRTLNHPGTTPEVPVDCYDFTGLKLTPPPAPPLPASATAWHYVRITGNSTKASRWKCIYPGIYDASQGNSQNPRFIGTHVTTPYDPDLTKNPAGELPDAITLINLTVAEVTTGSYKNPFNGIQVCNTDMGGFNKFQPNTQRVFPYGGFARVGDVVQAPFIGSYVVESIPKTVVLKGVPIPLDNVRDAVLEMNPITVDTCFADDGDADNTGVGKDDKFEQIGRLCPMEDTANNIDDYSIYGYYRDTDPDVGNTKIPNPTKPPNITKSMWRYRFAIGALNQFTTVSNPESDYFPNMSPNSWVGRPAGLPPIAVPNAPGGTAATINKNEFGTEGLLNINTASWRMLAAMEMIPRSQDPNGLVNAQLAKLIVRYRDVDDGIARKNAANTLFLPPQGHGAFTSLTELNRVFDPVVATPTHTFQNALGLLPTVALPADPTHFEWGNYVPGPAHMPVAPGVVDNLPPNDWVLPSLMVTRISNLVTTRSDTFTAYVIVQGWRNAQTPFPELVVQRRLAILLDRSALGLTNLNGGPKVYSVPAD